MAGPSTYEGRQVVENDTSASKRRTPFLLRQVVVPSWLQVLILGVYVYVLVKMLITNPLLFVVLVAMSALFGAYIRNPLRRHAGQGSDDDDTAEVAAAPTRAEASRIAWTKLRTYQVWLLVIVCLATTSILLDAVGIPMP